MKYKFNNIKSWKYALLWSIAKWQGLMNGELTCKIGSSCGCCQYDRQSKAEDCERCPVKRYTKSPYCRQTPISNTFDHFTRHELSKAERDFLIKVYRKYYGKFNITKFKQIHYPKMIKELKLNTTD